MAKKTFHLTPKVRRSLIVLGQQLQVARLKRNLTMELVAERAGIAVPTLRSLEAGKPTSSVGGLAMVLLALGLHEDLRKIAADDTLGLELQESGLRKRASRRSKSTASAQKNQLDSKV